MICRFKHNELCCNSGSRHYEYECKNCECMIPISNAERIRSMTDEELADYMSEHSIDDFCYIICGGKCKAVATLNKTSGQRCREIVSNWLKQPYKEADDA